MANVQNAEFYFLTATHDSVCLRERGVFTHFCRIGWSEAKEGLTEGQVSPLTDGHFHAQQSGLFLYMVWYHPVGLLVDFQVER